MSTSDGRPAGRGRDAGFADPPGDNDADAGPRTAPRSAIAVATEPAWARAASAIADEIRVGGLAPGVRLEPERVLGERLGVSRVTLRKALGSLVEIGLVTPSQGRGWFVGGSAGRRTDWPNTLESFTETARRKGLSASSRVLSATTAPATIDEAERLRMAPGRALHRIDRVRLLDGVPVARDASLVPADLVALPSDLERASLYAVLTAAGCTPVRAETTVEAHRADDGLARDLQMAPGDPVLVMEQLVTAADGRAVLASRIEYAGERYRLRTTFVRPSSTAPPPAHHPW